MKLDNRFVDCHQKTDSARMSNGCTFTRKPHVDLSCRSSNAMRYAVGVNRRISWKYCILNERAQYGALDHIRCGQFYSCATEMLQLYFMYLGPASCRAVIKTTHSFY